MSPMGVRSDAKLDLLNANLTGCQAVLFICR